MRADGKFYSRTSAARRQPAGARQRARRLHLGDRRQPSTIRSYTTSLRSVRIRAYAARRVSTCTSSAQVKMCAVKHPGNTAARPASARRRWSAMFVSRDLCTCLHGGGRVGRRAATRRLVRRNGAACRVRRQARPRGLNRRGCRSDMAGRSESRRGPRGVPGRQGLRCTACSPPSSASRLKERLGALARAVGSTPNATFFRRRSGRRSRPADRPTPLHASSRMASASNCASPSSSKTSVAPAA